MVDKPNIATYTMGNTVNKSYSGIEVTAGPDPSRFFGYEQKQTFKRGVSVQ